MDESQLGQEDLEMERQRADLVKAVLRRLEARSKFRSVAREIVEGLTDASRRTGDEMQFVGELDIVWPCNDPDSKGGKFSCAVFTCPPEIKWANCPPPIQFDRCEGQPNMYVCPKDFDCATRNFSCWTFDCGAAGGGGGFLCEQAQKEGKDFECVALQFDCYSDFDCKPGHVFWCCHNHECLKDFTCSAVCPVPHGCPDSYSRPDEEGQDHTPGDFICGLDIGGPPAAPDRFDCDDTFKCTAGDEFDCQGQHGEFNCGDGKAVDDFDCHATFECDSLMYPFECKGEFQCDVSAGRYNCDDHFCSNGFTCSEFYDCDGIYVCEGTFDCVWGGGETSFLCDETFRCVGTFHCDPQNLFLCEQPVSYAC